MPTAPLCDTLAEAQLANALTIDLRRRAAEPQFSEGIDKRLDPRPRFKALLAKLDDSP